MSITITTENLDTIINKLTKFVPQELITVNEGKISFSDQATSADKVFVHLFLEKQIKSTGGGQYSNDEEILKRFDELLQRQEAIQPLNIGWSNLIANLGNDEGHRLFLKFVDMIKEGALTEDQSTNTLRALKNKFFTNPIERAPGHVKLEYLVIALPPGISFLASEDAPITPNNYFGATASVQNNELEWAVYTQLRDELEDLARQYPSESEAMPNRFRVVVDKLNIITTKGNPEYGDNEAVKSLLENVRYVDEKKSSWLGVTKIERVDLFNDRCPNAYRITEGTANLFTVPSEKTFGR